MANKPVDKPSRAPTALTYRRRALVGQLWLRGYTERQIAEMIRTESVRPGSEIHGCEKTNHITVHYDVAANRQRWLEQMNEPTDTKRSDQVARLLDIQHQAWADFTNLARGNAYARASYLRIALEAEEKLAKILGTLAPTKITDGEGGPLVPPIVEYHFADGTVTKPPRNGHKEVVLSSDHDGNGSKPDTG